MLFNKKYDVDLKLLYTFLYENRILKLVWRNSKTQSAKFASANPTPTSHLDLNVLLTVHIWLWMSTVNAQKMLIFRQHILIVAAAYLATAAENQNEIEVIFTPQDII